MLEESSSTPDAVPPSNVAERRTSASSTLNLTARAPRQQRIVDRTTAGRSWRRLIGGMQPVVGVADPGQWSTGASPIFGRIRRAGRWLKIVAVGSR